MTIPEESKMKFVSLGQETRYSFSYFWNPTRIEKDLSKCSWTVQKSRILTIKIPFHEEIDPLLDNMQEERNTIEYFKRINTKNQEILLFRNKL